MEVVPELVEALNLLAELAEEDILTQPEVAVAAVIMAAAEVDLVVPVVVVQVMWLSR